MTRGSNILDSLKGSSKDDDECSIRKIVSGVNHIVAPFDLVPAASLTKEGTEEGDKDLDKDKGKEKKKKDNEADLDSEDDSVIEGYNPKGRLTGPVKAGGGGSGSNGGGVQKPVR